MTTAASSRPSRASAEGELAPRWRAVAAAAEHLSERIDRVRRSGAAVTSSDADPAPLTGWARAFAAGDQQALAHRLAWDGLTPAQGAAALGPAGSPDDEEPLPVWIVEAVELVGLGGDLRAVVSPLDLSDLPFAELWQPWVAAALAALAAPDRGARTAALPEASRRVLARGLAEEISRVGAVAAGELYRPVRALDREPGAYLRFAGHLLAEGLLPLFEAYPVLLRQLGTLTADWIAGLTELGERLAADRERLATAFAGGAPLGELAGVERLASDRHDGGRGVFRLSFAGGRAVVYKPRSVALEAGFASFVRELARVGLDPVPPTVAALERDGYGWMEWAEPGELADRGFAARWYRRAGTLVALAELLGAEDLHAENLVARTEGPAIVDAEMLLQPRRSGGDRARPGSFAAGLLRPPDAPAGDRAASWAGLHPAPERVVSANGRGWRGVGTDDPLPVPVAVVAPELPNAPRLAGERVEPEAFADTLVEGYENAWLFLVEHRAALAAPDGPLAAFRGARVRILFRASQDYASAIDLLASPRYQASGVAAGLLLEAMLRPLAGSERRPRIWPLVRAERRALERLDLPRFELAADAVAIAAEGETVEGPLARSGLDAVADRWAALTPAEIAQRVEQVTAALAPRRPLGAAGEAGAPPATGLDAVRQLADRVLALELDPGRRVRREQPAPERLRDLSLYDGRLGRALALAALDRRTGERRYAAVRDDLVEDLDEFARTALAADTAPALDLPLGALNGLGSLVWGAVALARATDDPQLLALAGRFAHGITADRLATDARLDLEGGAAGALLALLALAEATDDPAPRELARRAGERLRATRESQPEGGSGWRTTLDRPLAGYAHGASGIARALAALAEATGESRWLEDVAEALRFERGLYSAARGNWPVRLASPLLGETRITWMTAWCHGAAGIALGRSLLPAAARDEAVAGEIETAVGATLAAGAGTHDHLCCGGAGRYAALAIAGREAARADWLAAARAGAEALAEAEPRLPRSPRDPRGAAAGLFRGVAGVVWLAATRWGDAAEDSALLDPAALERPSEAERRAARRIPTPPAGRDR